MTHAYWRACNYLALGMIYLQESYLAQLHDMRDHANDATQRCLAQAPSNLQAPVQKLAEELATYWKIADHLLRAAA